ncbi:hypothetical protein KGM_200635 [Danaus plexippus plexippus]|uniref:Uncharacterized protein n=1 Tax=Danaus plexippus plexippus TaxID=278856 RepID=A0A212EUG9_DANPL|nr:hypothetical protein KGM_200635 [Danaus plexippus plexippus]
MSGSLGPRRWFKTIALRPGRLVFAAPGLGSTSMQFLNVTPNYCYAMRTRTSHCLRQLDDRECTPHCNTDKPLSALSYILNEFHVWKRRTRREAWGRENTENQRSIDETFQLS